MTNPFEDEDSLREFVIELSESDSEEKQEMAELFARDLPSNGKPWDLMQVSIQELHKQNYLTREQAERLTDQIQQVLNYVYANSDPDSEKQNNFDLYINGILATINYENGEIILEKEDRSVRTRISTIKEDKAGINKIEVGKPVDNPKNTRIKPRYYEKTNPDILTDQLPELAQEIKSTKKNTPNWIKYAIELHKYVHNNIESAPLTQQVQKPRNTLQYGSGGPGSKATLLASLYEAVGIICRITIAHDNETCKWRPILQIKRPDDIYKNTIAEKIVEYYTEDTGKNPSDLCPIVEIRADLTLEEPHRWILADPDLEQIGQLKCPENTSSSQQLTQLVTRQPQRDVLTTFVNFKCIEEHQYINL